MRAAVELAIIGVVGLLFSEVAWAQRAPTAPAAPTSDGAPIPVGQVRHDLGGRIELKSSSLELLSTSKTAIPANQRVPFTVQEVLAAAPADRKKLGVKADGSDAQVLVKQVNPARQTWRPISVYIEEINRYESWLNNYGYTLRDGPFAGRGLATSGDLGLKFGVAALPPALSGPTESYAPLQEKKLWGWQRVYEGAPVGWRDPAGRVTQPAVIPADGFRIVSPSVPPTRAPAGSNLGKLLGGDLEAVSGPGVRIPAGTLATQSAKCPPGPCALKFGVEYVLSPKGQAILNNDVVSTSFQCKVTTTLAKKPEDCGPAGAVTWEIRARQYYGFPEKYGVKWVDQHTNVCFWRQSLWPHEFESLYQPAPSYKPDQEPSVGTVQRIEGVKSKHLYQGTLGLVVADVRDCLPTLSKNSLFGAHACLAYESANTYAPKSPLRVQQSAGIDVGVSIFGFEHALVQGTADYGYTQPIGPGASQSAPGSSASVVNAQLSSSVPTVSKKEYFKGPEATVFIGPVPLTIRTFLEAQLNVGGAKGTMTAPPLNEQGTATGNVRLEVGANASVWGGFDAAVDAVVASAGISGKLSLLDSTLGGFVKTTLNPAANDVRADLGFGYKQAAMSGVIEAFVELDLIVYTKRWSVEIVRFDPLSTVEVPIAVRTETGYSVDPATEKLVCP